MQESVSGVRIRSLEERVVHLERQVTLMEKLMHRVCEHLCFVEDYKKSVFADSETALLRDIDAEDTAYVNSTNTN